MIMDLSENDKISNSDVNIDVDETIRSGQEEHDKKDLAEASIEENGINKSDDGSMTSSLPTTSASRSASVCSGQPDVEEVETPSVTSSDSMEPVTQHKSKARMLFSAFKKKLSLTSSSASVMTERDKILAEVKVDSLPQVFVVKYLGLRPATGLFGIEHTRQPLDALLDDMEQDAISDLPLTQLHVSIKGIYITEHKSNTATSPAPELGLTPLEFISFGAQDMKHARVFTFILVRELSARTRKLECHAYLCDSSRSCRRLALAVALAFEQYGKKLEGKPHKFQIQLQQEAEEKKKKAEMNAKRDVTTNGTSEHGSTADYDA